MFTALVLAILIGVSLGLLGGGGSILTVPVFVYLMGWEPKLAIAASLAVVGVTSLFGVLPHHRQGNLNYQVAIIFGAVAMFGTYLGARLSIFFSGASQLILFAFVMGAAAFFMLKPKRSKEASQSSLNKNTSYFWLGVEGLATGVLTGLVGVGGGFMIVPALVLLAHLPMKIAVGTSLLIIAFKSFAGFVGYLGQVQVPWRELGLFTAFSVIGIFIGSALVKKVPAESLKKIFGFFLILMSIFILYKNRDMLFGFWF